MSERRISNHFKIGLLLATGLLTATCQANQDSASGKLNDNVSIADAKKQRIVYRGLDAAPPRDISDIRAMLKKAKDKPEATEASAIVKQQPPQTDENATLAQFYLKRGRAAGELGMDQLELEDLRKAAKYSTGLDTYDVEEDRILSELAGSESRIGNLLEAIRLREKAIDNLSKRRGLIGLRINNFRFLAQCYARLGDFDKARDAAANAEEWLERGRRVPNFSYFKHNWPVAVDQAKADILEYQGKYAEAEPLRRQAMADRKQDIQDNDERLNRGLNTSKLIAQRLYAVATRELAANLVKQQRLIEAEVIVRRMIWNALSFRGRYFIGTGISFQSFAEILYGQGRYAEAQEIAGIALDIFSKLEVSPESQYVISARRVRAAALSAEGRYKDAVQELEGMRASLSGSPRLQATLGQGDVDWALSLMRTGRAAEAVSMIEPLVVDLRSRLGAEHYETAEMRGFLAMAMGLSKRREDALKVFAETVPVLTAASATTDGSTRSPARTRRYVILLEAYLNLLVDMRDSPALKANGIDFLAESFRIADMARAQGLQKSLTSGLARSAATDSELARLVKQEQEAAQKIQAQLDLMNKMLAAPLGERAESAIERMRDEIKQLQQERKDLYARIETKFPNYANLLNPKPATLDAVRSKLGESEALISIYVGEDHSYVWAIAKNGVPGFVAIAQGADAYENIVTDLRKALDPGAATLGDMPVFDVAKANNLFDSLLKPVASVWKGKASILVVPHRALSSLPFALLPTSSVALPADGKLLFDSYRNQPWLIRSAAITQYPSVNAFINLRQLPPADANRRMFVGFGDPLFNKQQLQEVQAEKPQQVASAAPLTRKIKLPLRNLKVDKVTTAPDTEFGDAALAVANTSQLAQVPRLPDTADEIKEIAKALGADTKEDVFLELRANENQVRSMDLSNRRVVMFATHGLIPGDLNGLGQPALALTAPQLAGVQGDGLLTMEEVLQLKLNADWVVLSACNTAAGDGQGGDSMSGLGRAFFYAGSRALLVTHWPVETTSARALTTELFRLQAQDAATSRAKALQQSMIKLIDEETFKQGGKNVYAYAHPLFWAPFALVGDGGH